MATEAVFKSWSFSDLAIATSEAVICTQPLDFVLSDARLCLCYVLQVSNELIDGLRICF